MEDMTIAIRTATRAVMWTAAAAALCAAVFGGLAGTAHAAEAQPAGRPLAEAPAATGRGLKPVRAVLPPQRTQPARAPQQSTEPALEDLVRDHWRHHGVG